MMPVESRVFAAAAHSQHRKAAAAQSTAPAALASSKVAALLLALSIHPITTDTCKEKPQPQQQDRSKHQTAPPTRGRITHHTTSPHPVAAIIDSAETPDDLDKFPAHDAPSSDVSKAPLWRRALWEGGLPIDGFLTAASAQVRRQDLRAAVAAATAAGSAVVDRGFVRSE